MKPAKHKFTVLKQVCELIPRNLVPSLAKKYSIKSRSFSPWSHVVSLVHCQLAHSLSLNDICDSLQTHSGSLTPLRGATAPSKNGLSHANRTRNADMAEELFWSCLEHLKKLEPNFGLEHNCSGIPYCFKRTIHVVDSTTIKLFANCLDWAKHRRRKAAAKCHMRLDLQSFLPSFALIKSAGSHDSTEAKELCASIKAGEIVVFDKAYVDYKHLSHLDKRDVFWVSRSKSNMAYKVMGQHAKTKGSILRDDRIILSIENSQKFYPKEMRLVEAIVKVDGKEKAMTFISNNFSWAASSIADLYKSRWQIEVFFKQMKQTLQLSDFIGHNENAVKWQVWTALLSYVLLRFISYRAKWQSSFRRLFTIIRASLFDRREIYSVLKFCGTAYRKSRINASPQQAYFPGFLETIPDG